MVEVQLHGRGGQRVLTAELFVHQVDLFAGIPPEGDVLVKPTRTLGELGPRVLGERLPQGRLLTVPATELAPKHSRSSDLAPLPRRDKADP
jgi:hypothetical protein